MVVAAERPPGRVRRVPRPIGRGEWILAKSAAKPAAKKAPAKKAPAKAEKPKAPVKAPAPKKDAKPAPKPAPKAVEKVAPKKVPEPEAKKPDPKKIEVKKVEVKKVEVKPAPKPGAPAAGGAKSPGITIKPTGKPMMKKPAPPPPKNIPAALLPKSKGGSSAPAPAPAAPGDKTRFKTPFQNDFSDGKAAAAKLFAAAGLGNLKHQKLPTLEEEMAAKPLTKTPLNKAQLKEFREILLAKRAELVGDVQSMEAEALTGGSGSLSNLPQHMADQGTDTFDQTMTLNIAASKRGVLRDIDAALRRIEDSTYGICDILGKPIEVARLQAEPWTRYCIEGARHKERMSLMR
ncbi:MAG: TraR/DksA family transcriptional regulator [Planctomycetes bacterium]|nr:TraR/DksA family transcriptional regulator [Planctomycetota bacterium]